MSFLNGRWRGLVFSALFVWARPLSADVSLPDVFSDHAVLLRSPNVPVWGWADPGERVTVEIAGQRAEAVAGAGGRWQVDFNLEETGPGPHELIVSARNRLTAADVLVGEVWLCSGQSNMAWPLAKTRGGGSEIGRGNGQIREFRVAMHGALTPQKEARGYWAVFHPLTGGDFSGVGYYFAKALQHALSEPVGLINATWGGTRIAAWMSAGAAQKDEAVAKEHAQLWKDFQYYQQVQHDYTEALERWRKEQGRKGEEPSSTPPSGSVWKEVVLPGTLAHPDLAKTGVTWLRREVELPPEYAGQPLILELGVPRDEETVFWNGVKLEERIARAYPFQRMRRQYVVPAGAVTAARNELSVRLLTVINEAGIEPGPDGLKIGSVDLSGPWSALSVFQFPEIDAAAREALPAPPEVPALVKTVPSSLFNGMMAPLIPYAIRGVIWYQGEADVSRPDYYRHAFPLLIADWREKWGREDLPFYFCQLPGYSPDTDPNGNPNWAEFRSAQNEALRLPKTGAAVLIDVGEPKNIHPENKKPVGDRLARLALAQTYGRDVVWTGPRAERIVRKNETVAVTFSSAEGDSVVRRTEGSVPGFALRDSQRGWIPAEARWDGGDLVVWAEGCSQPEGVRYAWENCPTAGIFNEAGLPAAPFQENELSFSPVKTTLEP